MASWIRQQNKVLLLWNTRILRQLSETFHCSFECTVTDVWCLNWTTNVQSTVFLRDLTCTCLFNLTLLMNLHRHNYYDTVFSVCYNVYTVNLTSVSWNTWIMIFLTLGHCRPSKPQPILGIDMLVTPWLTQWSLIAVRDDCKLLYVGLWKYFSLVTLNDKEKGMSLQELSLITKRGNMQRRVNDCHF